jgi:hypothetical protein
MNAIQCDRCGRIVHPDTCVDWLRVDYVGVNVRSIIEPPGPFHFDSLKCLVEWAHERTGVTDGHA